MNWFKQAMAWMRRDKKMAETAAALRHTINVQAAAAIIEEAKKPVRFRHHAVPARYHIRCMPGHHTRMHAS